MLINFEEDVCLIKIDEKKEYLLGKDKNVNGNFLSNSNEINFLCKLENKIFPNRVVSVEK